MDSLFFLASKVFWLLASPDSLIVLLVIATCLVVFLASSRWAKYATLTLALIVVSISIFPVGAWLLYPLEQHFPPPVISRVEGIIVLGGGIDPVTSDGRDQLVLNDSAERLHAMTTLMTKYPHARVVYTGGSGHVLSQSLKEADWVEGYVHTLGLDPGRVKLENESRNTAENARLSFNLVQPSRDEIWLLVTSAFHLPRSVGVFCRVGWRVTPYPVDYRTHPDYLARIGWDFSSNLAQLSTATREWLGLVAYRVTGKTDEFIPAGCALNLP